LCNGERKAGAKIKRVFAVALKLAQEVGKRRERKRGRPPTYLDYLYLALLILRSS
jgi:hypothetical protein